MSPTLVSPGLLIVTFERDGRAGILPSLTVELTPSALADLRARLDALEDPCRQRVTMRLRYVAGPATAWVAAAVEALARPGVRVVAEALGAPQAEVASGTAERPAAEASAAPPPDALVEPPAHTARAAPGRRHASPIRAALLRFLLDVYWRVEAAGLEHVPARGRVLLAANHTPGVPAEGLVLMALLALRHPAGRGLRVAYDRALEPIPLVTAAYRALGAIPATFAAMAARLAADEAVALFPEDATGATPRAPSMVRAFHTGLARLACTTGSPIVPVAITRAADAYPLAAPGARLTALLGLAPGVGCLLGGALPLPVSCHVRFLAPVTPPPARDAHDHRALGATSREVRRALADALGAAAGHAREP